MARPTPLPWYVQTTAPIDGKHVVASVPLDEDNLVAIVEGRTPEEARANAELIAQTSRTVKVLVDRAREVYAAIIDAPVLDDSEKWAELAAGLREAIEQVEGPRRMRDFAWGITDMDIFIVLQRHGKVSDVGDELVSRCYEMVANTGDQVEKAALRYNNLGDQAGVALDEIENILIEVGALAGPKLFSAPPLA